MPWFISRATAKPRCSCFSTGAERRPYMRLAMLKRKLHGWLWQKIAHAACTLGKSTRGNFLGERLKANPSLGSHLGWKEWIALLSVPLRHHKDPKQQQKFYFGYILGSLGRQHNFTWDTVPPTDSYIGARCHEGTIAMRNAIVCPLSSCVYGTSFTGFSGIRTLMASELLTHDPYQLWTLMMPFGPIVAFMLPGAGLLIGILLSVRVCSSKKSKARDWFSFSVQEFISFASFEPKLETWIHATVGSVYFHCGHNVHHGVTKRCGGSQFTVVQ